MLAGRCLTTPGLDNSKWHRRLCQKPPIDHSEKHCPPRTASKPVLAISPAPWRTQPLLPAKTVTRSSRTFNRRITLTERRSRPTGSAPQPRACLRARRRIRFEDLTS